MHGLESPGVDRRREEFNAVFRDWLQAQNEDFEKNGIWSDGLVAW